MIKLSVILPVYNKEKYIMRCIETIVNQSFKEFEVLIVDDGSTDSSGKICDELAEKDNRIHVFHIENGGVSNARNYALDRVNGEYVTFMDADDYVGERYLENLYECIVKTHVDIVISGHTKVWENNFREEVLKMPVVGCFQKKDILPYFAQWQNETGLFGYCVAKIFKKELSKGLYFDSDIKLAEDFDFYLKLYRRIETIYFDSTAEYFYLQEAENSSMIVKDYDINYFSQLILNLRYKKFLEENNSYEGMNQEILEQKISDYFYFTLFYCNIEQFENYFDCLYKLYLEQNTLVRGEGKYARYFLFLLKRNQKRIAKLSLRMYRFLRKIVRKTL